MTEKRFTKTSKNGYWQIKDNQADYKETFDLTNPQLIVDRLNALHEENKQLKQQVKQLKHWNKCLAEKRHQELSGYYTDSKAEKDLRDLLEPKLFNCSDR